MPVTISGTTVPSMDDLRGLQGQLKDLQGHVTRVERELHARLDESASRIRSLDADLKVEVARADTIEANIHELEKTLGGILQEAQQSSKLLAQVDKHLATSSDVLDRMTISLQEQTQAEATRRQAVTERLDQLLIQYQAQTGALRQSFAALESRIGEVADAQRSSHEEVGRAIRMLRDALGLARGQTQDELAQTIQSIQEFTRAKRERAQDEAESLKQVLAAQDQIRAHLESIRGTSHRLAESGAQAESQQRSRLTQTTTWRAHDLNLQATLLLHRGEFEAAIPLLEEAAQLAPEHAIIQTNRAIAYLKTDRYQPAEEVLLPLVAQATPSSQVFNVLGTLYLEQSKPQDALPHLERAADMTPDDAVIWLNLGKAHYACGHIAPAFDAWARARELEPGLVADDAAARMLLEEQSYLEV